MLKMEQMIKIPLVKYCLIGITGYMVTLSLFWLLVGSQFRWSSETVVFPNGHAVIGELADGTEIVQSFISPMDEIERIEVYFATCARINSGLLTISVQDLDTGFEYLRMELDADAFLEDTRYDVLQGQTLRDVSHRRLGVVFRADSAPERALMLYQDNTARDGYTLAINGRESVGTLTMEIGGSSRTSFNRSFMIFAIASSLILAAYCVNLIARQRKGKKSYGLSFLYNISKYRFLLNQLVKRDFKVKYKRSVLGVLWSLLNPLMTMLIQYIVFSTLFKSSINNFPVYLLIGIIFFSYFTETSSLGIGAIVDNASLITKVYVPKYIFPVSRVFSSCINLMLSLIPLVAVIGITGTAITPQYLLLILPLVLMTMFCLGMVMLLSSIMVYFRDTRFLWNVLSLLWMYATPIFYPESIIPEAILPFYRLNPMYRFIQFARIVVLEGVSPRPRVYLACFLSAVIPLIIGILVFKKLQGKFVLYI